MKCRGVISLLAVGLAWLCFAFPVDAVTPEERFAEAATAYDEGDFAEAIRLYQQLLRDGFVAAELYYNLGNSWYRQGDIGQAVLKYKQALYLRPRNADARHNLAFVMNEAGALTSELGWLKRSLRRVSRVEWVVLSVAFWWLSGLFASLALWRSWNFSWALPIAVTLFFAVVSMAGVAVWRGLERRPELVVVERGQDALFAPLEGSTPHFALPKGSIVRMDSATDGWYRVRVGDRDGWVRQRAVIAVRPGSVLAE